MSIPVRKVTAPPRSLAVVVVVVKVNDIVISGAVPAR
jgi:hypothetical protein